MSQEFITAATACGGIIMLWAIFTRDGSDDSEGGGAQLFVAIVLLPVVGLVIAALALLLPAVLSIFGIALLVALIVAALVFLWKSLQSKYIWKFLKRLFNFVIRLFKLSLKVFGKMLFTIRAILRTIFTSISKALKKLFPGALSLLRKFGRFLLGILSRIGAILIMIIRSFFRGIIQVLQSIKILTTRVFNNDAKSDTARILTKVEFLDTKSAKHFTMAKALKHLQDSLGKFDDHNYSLYQ